jgi:hypothetical protein
MNEDREKPARLSLGEGLTAGIAIFAIFGCCGLPLLAALASSVAIGTLLGVGGGILVAIALVAIVVARTRGRRRTRSIAALAPCHEAHRHARGALADADVRLPAVSDE